MISSVVFLIAWVFPPSIYSRIIDEPDLMFFNLEEAFFYVLCVGAFLLGVYLFDIYIPSGPLIDKQTKPGISPTAFVLAPVLLALVLNTLSLISVLREGVLLPLLLSGEGAEVKETTGAEGSLVLSATCLSGVVWWAIWRSQQLQVKGNSRRMTQAILCVAVLFAVLSAVLFLNRGVLFSALVGSVIIALTRGLLTGAIGGKVILKTSVILCPLVIVVFVLVSALRGADTSDAIASDLAGYTIASYNRLAGLLSGTLRYPYAGTGVYLSGFLTYNNLFNRIIPVREMLGWPSLYDVFKSEFWAVWRANLNGNLIWSGTFGYIYSDLGWFSPGFLFLYGLLYGLIWRAVRIGQAFGVVLYPWFAVCILFWVGLNYLLDTICAVLVIDSLALLAYDFVLLRGVTRFWIHRNPNA